MLATNMIRTNLKGDYSINDSHCVKVKAERTVVQKVVFYFLVINQVEQLRDGGKYMSKCGKGTVTPYSLKYYNTNFRL
jgi:hypothetical protein